jgi:hypothetical protein
MTKRVTTTICIAAAAAAWSVAPSAQTPEKPETTQQRQARPQARQAPRTVALVGCVEEGTTPTTFVLDVKEQPTASATQPGSRTADQQQTRTESRQAQATGTTGTDLVGQRVQLIGSRQTNLREHAGHEVEVTGRMAPQRPAPQRSGQATGETRFMVQRVRHIASTCTPASGTRGTTGVTEPEPQPATPDPKPPIPEPRPEIPDPPAPEPQPTPEPNAPPAPLPEPSPDR